MSGSGCWEEQSGTDDWREGEREKAEEGEKRKERVRRKGWNNVCTHRVGWCMHPPP